MEAGRLRNRVTLQEKEVTKDAYGAEVITWADVATVWAAVEPLAGREFMEGRSLDAELSTRIRIRYREGVRPTYRATWGDHVYDIQSVIDVNGRHRELLLMCRELPGEEGV